MSEKIDIMPEAYELTFRIDVFTPDSLPLARLAAYMADLANLLGERDNVHCIGLGKGSVVLVQRIERPAVPTVKARLSAIRRNEASDDAIKAFARLNRRLADDNTTATLADHNGADVIRFPGRETPLPLDYPGFRQRGSLDGVLRRTGSKKDPPRIMLVDGGKTWNCGVTWDLIDRLQPYINKGRIRVHGDGRWKRGNDAEWICEDFRIESFEPLDEATWEATAKRLQDAAPRTISTDVLGDLADLRGGDERPHR